MKKIIDISTFDRTVDFEALKKAGIAGVIIRAGYAQTNIDDYWIEHIKGANDAGLPAGAYWFSYAYTRTMAVNEALACIRCLRGHKIDLPVFFDFEGDSMSYAKKCGVNVSRSLLNSMAESFCDTIAAAGYKAGIYFNKDYRRNKYYPGTLAKYYQWYAYYNSVMDDPSGVDIWQYTSTAEIPGVPTASEDMNYLINDALLPSELDKGTDKDNYAKALQTALNDSYNCGLVIDGLVGPKTLVAIREHYLYYGVPTIRNNHVKWLQTCLNLLGASLAVDGSYGPATRKAVKTFQAEKMLTIDGVAGPATHQAILAYLE